MKWRARSLFMMAFLLYNAFAFGESESRHRPSPGTWPSSGSSNQRGPASDGPARGQQSIEEKCQLAASAQWDYKDCIEYHSNGGQNDNPVSNPVTPGFGELCPGGNAISNGSSCVVLDAFCSQYCGPFRQNVANCTACANLGGGKKPCAFGEEQGVNGECKPSDPPKDPPGIDNPKWAAQLNVCQQAHEDVLSSCDTEQSGWMQELDNVSKLAQRVTSGEQSVCGTVAAVSVGTKGAIATFAVMCSNAVGRCREACDTAGIPDPYSTDMRKQRASCERKGSEGKQAQERAVAASQSMAQAVQACAASIGGLEGAAQQHCARPENQNSPSCKITLGTPMATPDLAGGGDFPSRGGINHPGVNGGNPSAGRLPMNLGDDSREEPMLGNPNANQPPAQAVGGQQQSGARNLGAMVGGGAQPGGGAPSGGRTGLSGMVSNILSGFFGGGGGAGGSGGGSGWKSFFSGRSGSEVEKPVQQQTPDLRLFAPGGKYDPRRNRGIASKTIGRDGLAGPHDSVWKLVNNRYQVKRSSLMP